MRLTDLFAGNNQITVQNQVRTGQDIPVQRQTAPSDAGKMADIAPGQIVKGELVQSEDGGVQIRLPGNVLLNAGLDEEMPLETGKMMNFQVRSNGQTLVLTPLQTNLSVDGPVSRALEMAGLPVNSATGEMTKLMMQAGLPIDRSSLQQFYREMIHQPAGKIEDMVDLHRLGMEVNEENLQQMSSYKNLTHQLVSGLADTAQSLMETIGEMQEKGDVQGAAKLFLDTVAVLEESTQEMEQSSATEGTVSETVKDGGVPEAGQGSQAGKPVISSGEIQQQFEQILNQLTAEGSEEGDGTKSGALNNQLLNSDITAGKEQIQDALTQHFDQQKYSPEEQKDVLLQLIRNSSAGGNRELLSALLDSSQAKKLLADKFDSQWSITPQQVADQKEVENLYQRLSSQLRGISKALESAGQTEGPAFQNTGNMSQNLDFLQQVNQMYAYVQLPLKLQQGQANGDLYVYTNKRNLADKDGPITALLHLDMEHLGPVDVYVSMQSENVNTKFYVQDDEMLDFLETHMDLLTQRLEKRGYSISVQTTLKNQEDKQDSSGIAPVLAQTGHGVMLQARGFDVRT